MVRKRRVAAGGLSTLAVLGVAAGVVAATGGGPSGAGTTHTIGIGAAGTGGPSSAAATGAPAVSASATAGKGTATAASSGKALHHPGPAPTPAAGHGLIDGRTSAELLKQLLPAGLTTSHYAGQSSYRPAVYGVETLGSMSLDDGHGLGMVSVNVQQNGGSMIGADASCAARVKRVTDCVQTTTADGATLLVYKQDASTPPGGNGPTAGSSQWTADLIYPNAQRVVITEANYFDDVSATHEKGWSVRPNRLEPVLSLDQLAAIVTSSRWTLTVPDSLAAQAKTDITPFADITQRS